MKGKKSTILYVLQALKRGSSKEEPVSQTTIAKMLKLRGIDCDRKTVGRDIDCLIEFGYKITKIKGGGCYLEGDFFPEDEILLLNAGASMLALPVDEKKKLKDKIEKLRKLNKVEI